MDYKSQKTMTRKAARIIAKIMRKLFGYNDDEAIDPIAMIELVPDIIPNTFISIVENDKLDVNVPARCYFSNNNIIIEIKEEVYEGARIEKIGGYRMHIIHEIHEILRRPVSGCGGKIASHLITPGFVQGMLHNRHYFYMCIVHFLDIINNERCKLPVIAVFPAILRCLERAEIHLID